MVNKSFTEEEDNKKVLMIKLKDLLNEELTDADIKVGDAYKNSTARGFEVSFVYGRKYGGW